MLYRSYKYFTRYFENLKKTAFFSCEAIPFNPKAKTHTRNQWKKSGLLRQPYQCAKCGTQYEGENFDYLQHMENCNHNPFFFTSAQLQLQELPGNSPNTVKEDSESKKILLERTEERRQRFNIKNENFYRLQKNLYKYKRPIDKLQKNKIARQVQYEISETKREKEELQRRIQDADDAWIKTPLPDEVFDDVDMDGNVSYTMGPYKYNLEWYDFQKKFDQNQSYKYPPLATDYEKNWKPRKEGYLICQKKRDDELFKKYGTKVIRTTE